MGLIRLTKLVSPYCIGMEGNTSARFDTCMGRPVDGFVIKCSGVSLKDASMANNYVAFDILGNQLDNFTRHGSMETELHRFLYNRFPDIKFIAHTHPVNTLKILCSFNNILDTFAENRLYPEQVIFNGASSIVVPYACPGPKLASEVEIAIKHCKTYPKLILLKNHGIVACGKTVDECVAITETCEKSAEVFGGYNISGIKFLSEEAVRELLDNEQEKYRLDQLK